MNFYFGNRAVSRTFRDAIARELPGLGEHPAYWRFLQYLLFSDFRDEATGRIALPRSLIAAIEQKRDEPHYRALTFLDAFRRDVLAFDIGEHLWTADGEARQGRVRTIQHLILPAAVDALAQAERRRIDSKNQERVCMATGKTWDWRQTKALRESELAEANERASAVEMCPETALAFTYLNSLKPHRFTAALRHLPIAIDMADKCDHAERELNILHGLHDRPMPTYVPSDKTARLYTLGPSVLHLHRHLRKMLTQDWVVADLKSAQLAIVARVWGVGEINDYLQTGQSIWPDLCAHLGLEFTDAHKSVVKTALYAITFGAGRRKLQTIFGALGNGKMHRGLFLRHPVIQALLKARAVQFKQIRRDGGARDACGRFILLQRAMRNGQETRYDNRRAVLACVAQSYELCLLKPVFEMAAAQRDEPHGFTITTLLHDGITFVAHHPRDTEIWKEKITDAVRVQAQALGILTEIEYS